MGIRLLQHPSGRFYDLDTYCVLDASHPRHLESSYECSILNCVQCTALQKCRSFVNLCFVAQHQENTPEAIIGRLNNILLLAEMEQQILINFSDLLERGRDMVAFLTKERLFSVLFLPRRNENRRGIPGPAALVWALLEETRQYLELQFNEDVRISGRPLRDCIEGFIGT